MDQNKKDVSRRPEGRAKEPAKKQGFIMVLCAAVIICAVLLIGIKNIVDSFYGSFVLHDANTSTALESVEPFNESDQKTELLSPLETQWDLYRDARLEERVTATADDGVNLSGLLYDDGFPVTVIALHGFDGSAEGDFLYGPFLGEELHANLLLPDSRDHGESGGTCVSYGYFESDDLLQWVNWVIDRYGNDQKIVIYGDTMGAATALMAASRLPENVKLIITESPYDSLEHVAKYELKTWYSLPSVFLTLLQWRGSDEYSLGDVVVTDAVGSAAIPALFLAGTEDTYLPETMTRAVYDDYGGEKELVEVDAQHGLLYATDSEKVESAIEGWWSRFVQD
ncbi:MAG: Prolyl oligopeptidase family [Oscillospiraceae bacterium]|nr:Prolyl oligopeptidase family [Oscillospiraceae bacterium]